MKKNNNIAQNEAPAFSIWYLSKLLKNIFLEEIQEKGFKIKNRISYSHAALLTSRYVHGIDHGIVIYINLSHLRVRIPSVDLNILPVP